ncbi:putative histone chaperone domain chz [Golovinomyces cichoracearum]|uniref:Putative histone chaperone domain chz n=1 Tax=Golovinomyces cichoracearum TaxID=62708 RepID=A0A420IHK8_9PEZI|nr:putative histone chaperone domain chz [Golovinomyces cichoracearum]
MSEQPVKSDSEIKTPITKDEEVANTTVEDPAEAQTVDKGKGISTEPVAQDISMDEAESSSEDEGQEVADVIAEDLEEDNLEEIDPDNIITSERRTRGRTIDFAKAAEEMGPDDDDDEEDDEDFQAVEDEEMKD